MLQMLQFELRVVGDDVEAIEQPQRVLAGAGDVDDIDLVSAAIELHEPDRRAVRVERRLSGHLPARVERLRLLRRSLDIGSRRFGLPQRRELALGGGERERQRLQPRLLGRVRGRLDVETDGPAPGVAHDGLDGARRLIRRHAIVDGGQGQARQWSDVLGRRGGPIGMSRRRRRHLSAAC